MGDSGTSRIFEQIVTVRAPARGRGGWFDSKRPRVRLSRGSSKANAPAAVRTGVEHLSAKGEPEHHSRVRLPPGGTSSPGSLPVKGIEVSAFE
jgi:hypothetical protein